MAAAGPPISMHSSEVTARIVARLKERSARLTKIAEAIEALGMVDSTLLHSSVGDPIPELLDARTHLEALRDYLQEAAKRV